MAPLTAPHTRMRRGSVSPMTEVIAPRPGPRSWEPALSASRAKEYERCPLQYRLHVIDGYREPATRATAMGTLIHAVLEDLYGLEAPGRTEEAAQEMVGDRFEALLRRDPTVGALFDDDGDRQRWLGEVRAVLGQYFAIEDPKWIAPWAREKNVEASTRAGVRLRGFIDRIDRSPDGRLRVVDYKTGKAPSPRFTEEALFQMRFYALLLMRTAVLPARMQLVYLKSGRVLTLDPFPGDIERFEERVEELWGRIEADVRGDGFAPRKNPLCNWCGVRSLCPVFGGQAPPMPAEHAQWVLGTRKGA